MSAIRQLMSIFGNSPTYARDRVNLVSSLTIGFAALVLNGSVLIAVLILLFDPREFSGLAERVEFGQLLGIVLLTGATIFATLLIPLRLSGVFMGPRIGRYFDQVVLTGISPIRFLMGKVTSQNLYLGLMLFLMLPWFVLVLAVGGLDWEVFLGNLFLVWLYCMMLALLMLWLSLYFNEVLALLIILALAAVFCPLGGVQIPYQPFVITPLPALLRESYEVSSFFPQEYIRSYGSIFLSSVLVMGVACLSAMVGICVGPLYGIMRDNSTFGEVVLPGDSKRKRWLRLRYHIQRPSEIAFFYQNRSDVFRSWEGVLRWGSSLLLLLGAMAAVWGFYGYVMFQQYQAFRKSTQNFWSFFYMESNIGAEVIHGFTMAIGAIVFNHARNTVYQKVRCFGRFKATVSRLDWMSFLLILVLSSSLCYGLPTWLHESYGPPNEPVGIPGPSFELQDTSDWYVKRYSGMNIWHVHLESTIILSICAMTIYVMLRALSLLTWVKTLAVFVGAVAFVVVCMLGPFLLALFSRFLFTMEFDITREWAWITMMSPVASLGVIYREMTGPMMEEQSTWPFYLYHLTLITAFGLFIRQVGGTVKRNSLAWQARGESP